MDRAEIEKLTFKPTARKKLGKYTLLGRIGAGGMGKIYLAYAPGPAGIEKLLVIKRLHSHLTENKQLVENFLDEARLSMVLNHPNIVHTYDVGEVSGRYFMVMEYIAGQSLGVLLRSSKRADAYWSSYEWAGVFGDVLDGLHAAHTAKDARGRELEIIHRDISPQNILVGYDGVVRLVDFGIAKAAMRISETDAGVLKGKYSYMSPEQCQGKSIDVRSDVFSAGIVLWEMLAGRRLYKADNVVKSVERIVREKPFSPTVVNSECPAALGQIAVKALSKRPSDRFDSAADFGEAIEEVLRKNNFRSHARDVEKRMNALFADVVDNHQKVLAESLQNAASEHAFSEHEDSTSALAPMLTIESEATSAQRRRPVVKTREGGEESDKISAARTLDRQAPLFDDSDESGEVIPANEVTKATPPPISLRPRAPVAQPRDESQTPKKRAAILLMLLLVGLAVLSGLLFFVLRDNDETGPKIAKKEVLEKIEGANTKPDLGDKSVNPKGAGPEGTKPTKPEGAKPEGAKPEGAKPEVVTPDEPQRARADSTMPKAKPKKRRRKKTPLVVKETPPKKAPALEQTYGYLSLQTLPWTTVYLKGKSLGNTPLVRVRVPTGELKLVLKNKDEAISQTYLINVKEGKHVRRTLPLQ